jgi:hypothetical protein
MIVDQAIQLAKSDEEAGRNPTELAQRIAIGIVQGRALECRTLAGQLLINGHRVTNQFPPGPGRAAAAAVVSSLSVQQRERSHRLEQLGLKLAKIWPPDDGEDFEESIVQTLQ